MTDDEQFSLCWNNFNTNLSAGFHESLCRGDLVDVTLAAEGQLVKAHRLVLSVCSPYFRKMFTQMPANQHAFVFLKDVSHAALKDLIQFMYCGEVNVKQDALPAFISTAEALQIKGLTETGDQTTAPSAPVVLAPSPAKETTRITNVPTHQASVASSSKPVIATRVVKTRPTQYKIESADESSDEKIVHLHTTPTTQTLKRVAAKSINPPSISTKRLKVTSVSGQDPLESIEVAQIAIQEKEDEFITLPIEMNPKNEPHEYEAALATSGDTDAQDQEATFVEDEAYGEMSKYEEPYFTEGEVTGKVEQPSFGENYSVTEQEQASGEAQGETGSYGVPYYPFEFIVGRRGSRILQYNGVRYTKNRVNNNGTKIYWICSKKHTSNCNARVVTYEVNNHARIIHVSGEHVHVKLEAGSIRRRKNTAATNYNIISSQDAL